jgi:two-component sensor histidine kinase
MALIHERLYRSEDLGHINFADYIKDLVSYLRLSYGGERKNIIIRTDVKDVFLDINTAIPCGLIINELISNALKHAFIGRKSGRILIQLTSPEKDTHMIMVKDDGVGFPDDIDHESPDSLGLQLVNDLVKQLRGTLILDQEEGTIFKVTF